MPRQIQLVQMVTGHRALHRPEFDKMPDFGLVGTSVGNCQLAQAKSIEHLAKPCPMPFCLVTVNYRKPKLQKHSSDHEKSQWSCQTCFACNRPNYTFPTCRSWRPAVDGDFLQVPTVVQPLPEFVCSHWKHIICAAAEGSPAQTNHHH